MMSYKNSIEQDAKIYGYKSANLIELKEVLEEFEEMISSSKKLFGNLKADVPAFYLIDEKLVRDHLNEYVPEWNDSFKKFQKSYEQQTEKNILSDESKAALSQLQDTITACFEDNPIPPDLFQEFLSNNNINENDLLMVRSTGVNEDKANMANPGGNKSIPCRATPREISKALGIVAASYVGEKSLSQRLSSGDKSITDLPVMPGLVQKMIGEGVGGLSNQVFSGVLYTNQGATRIQAAPGHGEYVVNSKGKVDNYYVSASDQRSKNNAIQSRHHESFNDYASNNNSDSEKIPGEYIGIVYSDIAIKDLRLKPLIGNDGKVNLVGIENAANLKYVSSLDEKAVLYLSELSRFVENKYGSRMDIEFVYDAESGHINIVQARAIPEGKRVGLTPSSIAPEFLSQNKSELIVVECLQVITPEVNRAAVVTRDSQMIVTSTIEEALSKYLASNNKEEVQVVIVQNPSPDTSHEAGMFNNAGIRVLQVKEISSFEKLLVEKKSQPIVVDPQHSKIYQLPKEYIGYSEDKLYASNILNEGIYASALSGRVCAIKHEIRGTGIKQEVVATDNILEDKSFGRLLQEAKSGDKKSTEELLSLSFKVMSFKQNITQNKDILDVDEKMRTNLDSLSMPKIGSSNDDLQYALGYNLRLLTDASKQELISKDLFKQAIISGTELSVMLDKMSDFKDLNKQQQDKAYLEYFDVAKKFEGLMVGSGDSLATHLKKQKYKLKAEELNKDLKGSAREYLVESLKLRDYLINNKSKKEWDQFCAKICTKEANAIHLAELVNKVVSLNVHEQWINSIFIDKNDPKNPEVTLKKLEEDFTTIHFKPIQEATEVIKTMESQIPLWRKPGQFDKLYSELQENVKGINQKLEWDNNKTDLEKLFICEAAKQLVDVMDKSSKSLTRSKEYGDSKDARGNDLQAIRFKGFLQEFHKIMDVWAEQHPNKIHFSRDYINEILTQDKTYTKNDLKLSDNFSVARTNINVLSKEIEKITPPSSLEDALTCIHQNAILAIDYNFSKLTKNIDKQYPDLVNNLLTEFKQKVEEKRVEPNISYISNISNNILTVSINTPLRGHSCVTKINYDTKTQDTYLSFSMIGENEHNRWLNNTIDEEISGLEAGLSFIVPPYFDEAKEYSHFEVKFNKDSAIAKEQAEKIISRISTSIENSYCEPRHPHLLLQKRIQKLDDLEKSKKEIDHIKPIIGADISWKELKTFKSEAPEFFKSIFSDSKQVGLLQAGFTLKTLYELDKQENILEKKFVIEHLGTIKSLSEAGLKPQEFLDIRNKNEQDASYLIKNAYRINSFSKVGLKPQEFLDIRNKNEQDASYLMNNAERIKYLSEAGLKPQEFLDIRNKNEQDASYLIKNAYRINSLSEAGLKPQEFLDIRNKNKQDASYLIDNALSITTFHSAGFKITDFHNIDKKTKEILNLLSDNILDLLQTNSVTVNKSVIEGYLQKQSASKSQNNKDLSVEEVKKNYEASLRKPDFGLVKEGQFNKTKDQTNRNNINQRGRF